jgi:8-oxo-dGTP diphosphatase
MSPPGRPKGESLSEQREGFPVSPPGRPKGESLSEQREGSQVSAGPLPGRKVTEVAVGVLLRPDGAVLLADRPAGKPYAGYWEFPGGKIEQGETIEHAVARELHEELGIDIGTATPWVTFEFDYPHAYVRLHFRRVRDWRGTPHGREGQRTQFHRLDDPLPAPLLPAAVPALRWLGLPTLAAEVLVGEGAAQDVLAQVDAALAGGLRLMLLRRAAAPAVPAASFSALVAAVMTRAQAHLATVLVQSDPGDHDAAAAHGVHLGAPALARAFARPAGNWVGADADSRALIDRAARLGCDLVVTGPVFPDPGRPQDGAALGWHGFEQLARHAPVPVFARGGLSLGDLDHAQQSGAHGLVLPLAACRGAAAPVL